MRDSFKKTIAEFDTQVTSIKRQLALMDYLVRGSPALEGLAISKTQEKNMNVIARAMSVYISGEMRAAIQNGAIIIIAAFFEDTVRSLLRDALLAITDEKKYFHELSSSIQKNQIRAFGSRFLEMKDPGELFQIEFVTQIENMLLCARKDEGYVLLASEIAKNKNNLRSAELTDLCSRIGIVGVWEKIARQKELQDYLGQYNEKFVISEATHRLNSFVETRNNLTHYDPGSTSFGRDWIVAQVEFLVAVIKSVAHILDDHVSTLAGAATSTPALMG
jgi:hypothetical protein